MYVESVGISASFERHRSFAVSGKLAVNDKSKYHGYVWQIYRFEMARDWIQLQRSRVVKNIYITRFRQPKPIQHGNAWSTDILEQIGIIEAG